MASTDGFKAHKRTVSAPGTLDIGRKWYEMEIMAVDKARDSIGPRIWILPTEQALATGVEDTATSSRQRMPNAEHGTRHMTYVQVLSRPALQTKEEEPIQSKPSLGDERPAHDSETGQGDTEKSAQRERILRFLQQVKAAGTIHDYLQRYHDDPEGTMAALESPSHGSPSISSIAKTTYAKDTSPTPSPLLERVDAQQQRATHKSSGTVSGVFHTRFPTTPPGSPASHSCGESPRPVLFRQQGTQVGTEVDVDQGSSMEDTADDWSLSHCSDDLGDVELLRLNEALNDLEENLRGTARSLKEMCIEVSGYWHRWPVKIEKRGIWHSKCQQNNLQGGMGLKRKISKGVSSTPTLYLTKNRSLSFKTFHTILGEICEVWRTICEGRNERTVKTAQGINQLQKTVEWEEK
ncbi:hypothetical protein QBC35DRAFT_476830 [Podospora australis]|uniref:Uncharacterized protein n=1 Tax=Podospora australis TaxID=1536484 RepID=A0AAN6WP63_9PEZI|nr:hypothetical protein QBC35DRAFT_476830 [Podospora australis]